MHKWIIISFIYVSPVSLSSSIFSFSIIVIIHRNAQRHEISLFDSLDGKLTSHSVADNKIDVLDKNFLCELRFTSYCCIKLMVISHEQKSMNKITTLFDAFIVRTTSSNGVAETCDFISFIKFIIFSKIFCVMISNVIMDFLRNVFIGKVWLICQK